MDKYVILLNFYISFFTKQKTHTKTKTKQDKKGRLLEKLLFETYIQNLSFVCQIRITIYNVLRY